MSTDDELGYYSGSAFMNVEVLSGPEEGEDEFGGCVTESRFLVVTSDRGKFTVVNYNEHNGYYGGFSIQAKLDT